MRQILYLILILITVNSNCQYNISYHQYEPTASDYKILRWNLPEDSINNYKWYVKETTDNLGRVIKLEFRENGTLNKHRLCYLPDYVIYRYPDEYTIIEELHTASGSPMNGIECEVPYKRKYILDKSNRIIDLEIDYHIDTTGFAAYGRNKEHINTELEYIERVKKEVMNDVYDEFSPSFIRYYLKSYSKYMGIFPQFIDSDIDWYQFDNLEYRAVTKSIKKGNYH